MDDGRRLCVAQNSCTSVVARAIKRNNEGRDQKNKGSNKINMGNVKWARNKELNEDIANSSVYCKTLRPFSSAKV